MRTLDEARKHWAVLEDQRSLSDLRIALKTANNGAPLTSGLRSVSWKAFLLFKDLNIQTWPQKLQISRDRYTSLRSQYMRSIENPNEVESFVDPLSEDLDSPWDALRKDETLRQEINQDVERCMPDNHYFRQPATQVLLLDMLFVWAKLNEDVGYRQGMHELLAPILWVVEMDAIDLGSGKSGDRQNGRDHAMKDVFDAKYIAHDTFTLFEIVMKQLRPSYERSEQDNLGAHKSGQSKSDIGSDSSIIARSNRIIDDYLGRVDPALTAHLNAINIVPQVFLMRWIRLLFGREFDFEPMLQVWDRLFSEILSSRLIDLTCVAMLLRIRWELLEADYNTSLQLLFHYPEPDAQHPAPSFVDDALYLRDHLDVHGGHHIILKRTDKPPPLLDRPSTPSNDPQSSHTGFQRNPTSPMNTPSGRGQQSAKIESIIQDAARGVYRRGEKWGVNKAMRDAMGEVRKNVSNLHSRTNSFIERRGDTENDGSLYSKAQLLGEIDALHSRNKSLAKILQDALGELWQSDLDGSNSTTISEDRSRSTDEAIAKVQYVQILLQDSSLELPSEEALPTATKSAEGSIEEDNVSLVQPDSTSTTSGMAATAAASESTSVQQDTPPIIVEPNREQRASADAMQQGVDQTGETGKAPVRPALAESTFSWMLGQEERKTSSARNMFMSASRFTEPDGANRTSLRSSNAFLFGYQDDDDAAERSGSLERKSPEKVKQEAAGTNENEFRLANIDKG